MSDFKYIPKERTQLNYEIKDNTQMEIALKLEIAFQLKRLCDLIENKELAMKVREW